MSLCYLIRVLGRKKVLPMCHLFDTIEKRWLRIVVPLRCCVTGLSWCKCWMVPLCNPHLSTSLWPQAQLLLCHEETQSWLFSIILPCRLLLQVLLSKPVTLHLVCVNYPQLLYIWFVDCPQLFYVWYLTVLLRQLFILSSTSYFA